MGLVDPIHLLYSPADQRGAEAQKDDAGERVAEQAEAAQNGAGKKVGAGGVVAANRLKHIVDDIVTHS